MGDERVSTGCEGLDRLLGGGFERGCLSTVFGPAGAGKTNLCIMSLIRMAGTGRDIVYVDSEASFPFSRLEQITRFDDKVLDHTRMFKPHSFEEQERIVLDNLPEVLDDAGLLIFDTIGGLYRVARSEVEDESKVDEGLSRQVAHLARYSRDFDIPVLLANQVYSDLEGLRMIGQGIVDKASKYIIRLEKVGSGLRRAVLVEPDGGSMSFRIVDEGVRTVE